MIVEWPGGVTSEDPAASIIHYSDGVELRTYASNGNWDVWSVLGQPEPGRVQVGKYLRTEWRS